MLTAILCVLVYIALVVTFLGLYMTVKGNSKPHERKSVHAINEGPDKFDGSHVSYEIPKPKSSRVIALTDEREYDVSKKFQNQANR